MPVQKADLERRQKKKKITEDIILVYLKLSYSFELKLS